MSNVAAIARRKAIYFNGVLTPEQHSFLHDLPGFHKYLDSGGAMFSASRKHIELFREAFPDGSITDLDGTLASVCRTPAEITDHGRITTAPLPLFVHQRRAVNIALSREYYAFFYDMGTGKSAIILNIAAELFARKMIDRAVVFTSKRVVSQFVEEQAPMHMPKDITYRISAFPTTASAKLFKYPGDDLLVAVSGYGALQSLKQTVAIEDFAKGGRTAIFLDECQSIKNASSKRFKHLWQMRQHFPRRYLFSGEPAPLGPIDLYSQFKFLDENIIGHSSLTSFKNTFCVMGGFENRQIRGYRNTEELADSISNHSEYLKIDSVQDMPEQVYVTKRIQPTAEQARMYAEMKNNFIISLKGADDETPAGQMRIAKNAAAQLMVMQQIACGHFLSEPEGEDGPRNVVVLNNERADFVAQELVARNSKTVIFARFRADLDALQHALDREDIQWVELSGRQGDVQNEVSRRSFVDGDAQVLISTAASGGTGLNLQCAHTTVFYSNSWSYGDRVQAEARTWRTGQSNRCVYFDLVTFPIDNVIRSNLLAKRDLSAEIRTLSGLRKLVSQL